MATDTLFSIPAAPHAKMVTVFFERQALQVPAGITVAAALLAAGIREFRTTPVGGVSRAPFCMMGVCFECLVEIDDVPSRQSCLVTVQEGMRICRQIGATEVAIMDVGEQS